MDAALKILPLIGGGMYTEFPLVGRFDFSSPEACILTRRFLLRKIRQPLEKLVSAGTPWQAKQAIRTIVKMFDHDSAFLLKVAKVRLHHRHAKLDRPDCRLQSCVSRLDTKAASLPTTLTALGYIALLKPHVFKAHWTAVIDEFIFKQLLMNVRVCTQHFTLIVTLEIIPLL